MEAAGIEPAAPTWTEDREALIDVLCQTFDVDFRVKHGQKLRDLVVASPKRGRGQAHAALRGGAGGAATIHVDRRSDTLRCAPRFEGSRPASPSPSLRRPESRGGLPRSAARLALRSRPQVRSLIF